MNWMTFLIGLAIVFNLTSNLVGSIVTQIGMFNTPLGIFIMPMMYVVSDVLSEVYGYKVSRFADWLAIGANILFISIPLILINTFPIISGSDNVANALTLVLAGSSGVAGMWRVTLAGCLGVALGTWVKDLVWHRMKGERGVGDGFMMRKCVASLLGQCVDTIVFISIAFIGTMPLHIVATMYPIQIAVKWMVEMVMSPISKAACVRLYVADVQ